MKEKKGCYFCLREFSKEEIKEKTCDGYDVCPYCGVDSVASDVENLEKKHVFYFCWAADSEGEFWYPTKIYKDRISPRHLKEKPKF